MKRYYFLGMILFFLLGCTLAEVRVNVVSERTALENQILGSYNSLSQDPLLAASVRGVDPLGRIQTPPQRSREYQDAMEAMQTLAFHTDDVEAFKSLGWVGENNEGLLTTFSRDKTNVSEELKEFANRYKDDEFNAVVKEVNTAREAVMLRIVETNENFSLEDLPKIHRVFSKLNKENSLSGEKIQTEEGSWVVKK
jgi:uncharacterized protein YdbL (DUF1318 family)